MAGGRSPAVLGARITNHRPVHRDAAAALRAARQLSVPRLMAAEFERRALTDYDRAFGLDGQVA